MDTPNGLIHFSRARQELQKAKTIDEVKTIRDAAERLRLYLKQSKESLEMQNDAAEIGLRAERKAGKMLKVAAEKGERRTKADGISRKVLHDVTPNIPPKLDEVGITRIQSARWQAIASIPDEEFENAIEQTKTERRELTRKMFNLIAKEQKREEAREQNKAIVNRTVPISAGLARYQTIVIDPPWDREDMDIVDVIGRARPLYATMRVSEIGELPVGELSERDAHIYLWIMNRALPHGFALLDGWGFRYVTILTWCKPSIGVGNYFRGSTEHVLFGVKGSLQLLRSDVGTWFQAPRPGRHSAKPPEFFKMVEECSPGPWLEMFARETRPGWVSWGAEIETGKKGEL